MGRGAWQLPAGPGKMAGPAWALLARCTFEVVHPYFGEVFADFDLAPTQAMALRELAAGQPLSMRELARRLRCDPSNVTGVTDRMEARGLVERRAEPGDRRVKTLALTPAGVELGERLAARLQDPPDVMARLGEEDQRLLRDLLGKLLEHDV